MNRWTEMNNGDIAVVGFGKSGKAALDFLLIKSFTGVKGAVFQKSPLAVGGNIYLYNDTPITEEEEKEKYQSKGVIFLIGEEQFPRLEEMGLVILSPGVDGRKPRFDRLREKGVVIISEIELATAFIPPEIPIIAITGTNGKSTTVSLVHHLLRAGGRKSFLAGNIGTPFIDYVKTLCNHPEALVVLEVSSFQLEEIVQFRPHVGLILNLTPDHLDRYPNTGEYYKAKLNLVKNQQSSDYLVLNADDPELRGYEQRSPEIYGRARRLWFTREKGGKGPRPAAFAGLGQEEVLLNWGNVDFQPEGIAGAVEKISLKQNPLRGVHNLENILAAVIAVRLLGITPESIESGLAHFRGLPHRMESAGKIGDVEFINDSKATNVDAALKSIAGITGPLVLILGGKDKGSDFTVLGTPVREKVERVLLLGKAGPTIRAQLEALGGLEEKLEKVVDMADAVARGMTILEKTGGVVLLAPGCASFDMYNNFEHRGEVFKQEVKELRKRWPLKH